MVQGISSRDLKLENLLLDRDGHDGTRPLLKICDFGYSKVTDMSWHCSFGNFGKSIPHILHGYHVASMLLCKIVLLAFLTVMLLIKLLGTVPQRLPS